MIVELTTRDGNEVLVELDDAAEQSVVRAFGVDDRIVDTFDALWEKVRPVINSIVAGLGNLDLDQVSVKFSVKVSAEGKIIFIGSGKVEGGIELGLTWKPQPATAS